MICEKSKDQVCKVVSYEANVRLVYNVIRKPGIKKTTDIIEQNSSRTMEQ